MRPSLTRLGPAMLVLFCLCCVAGTAAVAAESAASSPAGASGVNFSHAFATPHRITIGRPESSDRTLLDLQPGSLRMAWTYDDLTHYPLAAFKTPPTAWDIRVTPQVDGHGLARSRWTRLDGWLPALDNIYEDAAGSVRLEALGGTTAALVRVEVANADKKPHQFVVRCEAANWGENPAWVDPSQERGDNLVAGWNERADRLLILGVGAETYSLERDGKAAGPKTMLLVWNLKPGEKRSGWIIRPYRSYAADLPDLRKRDWGSEWTMEMVRWHDLVDRAASVEIPDPGVVNAYRACLADLFIMREPVAEGYLGGVPGTEVYRAPNSGEAGIVAVALDQLGLHREAVDGYRISIDMQEPDGNWHDKKGWGHLVWCCSGFKARAVIEHYRCTGDREYLAKVYPRLVASSRWQERQRQRTRVATGGQRPVTYGLLPRGFGDCGLMNDGDMYGVFLPHNIWAVYADRIALEAAQILGRSQDIDELRRIYETAHRDLLAALDRGAIREKDYRWIPGVAGKTSGSRWGVLNALHPCALLPADHELVTGSLRKIESAMSPGGIPMNTGWLADGMWVAITLDNVAEVHLARGNGDAAAKYLYATLNHSTPLYTWCEERGPEPGSSKCTGDRQHLWTPVAVVRAIRDCLVMEEGGGLHLALGTDRRWLASGKPVGIERGASHFGNVSFSMQYDKDSSTVKGRLDLPEDYEEVARRLEREPGNAKNVEKMMEKMWLVKDRQCPWAKLHVRLPGKLRLAAVNPESGAEILPGGGALRWKSPRGTLQFQAKVKEVP
jgi:hypothetical protein